MQSNSVIQITQCSSSKIARYVTVFKIKIQQSQLFLGFRYPQSWSHQSFGSSEKRFGRHHPKKYYDSCSWNLWTTNPRYSPLSEWDPHRTTFHSYPVWWFNFWENSIWSDSILSSCKFNHPSVPQFHPNPIFQLRFDVSAEGVNHKRSRRYDPYPPVSEYHVINSTFIYGIVYKNEVMLYYGLFG